MVNTSPEYRVEGNIFWRLNEHMWKVGRLLLRRKQVRWLMRRYTRASEKRSFGSITVISYHGTAVSTSLS